MPFCACLCPYAYAYVNAYALVKTSSAGKCAAIYLYTHMMQMNPPEARGFSVLYHEVARLNQCILYSALCHKSCLTLLYVTSIQKFFLPLEFSRTALLGCCLAASLLCEASRWQLTSVHIASMEYGILLNRQSSLGVLFIKSSKFFSVEGGFRKRRNSKGGGEGGDGTKLRCPPWRVMDIFWNYTIKI